MNKKSVIINSLLSLTFGGVLFYLVFKSIDFSDFYNRLTELDFFWIYLSMFISIFEHVIRGYRWNLMMEVGQSKKFSTFVTTNVIIISYFFALIIPRFNDVVRCYLISKTDEINFSKSLGSVVSERFIDIISLLILIIFFLVLEFQTFILFIKSYIIDYTTLDNKSIIVFISFLIISIIISRLIIKKSKYLENKFNEFKDGLISVKFIYNDKRFLLSTLFLWVTYFLMGYLIFFSFSQTTDLGINAGIAVLVAGSIGMVVPVNAGIGAYHFLVASILLGYNLDYESGLFFATVLHTSQIVCLLVVGTMSSIYIFFKIRSKS
ncbi:MAG: lysylphosphatidylglycerol synthase transmembrane domain-containing protein [Bacteroidota bacterium]|nr:lysylphosphatidylglycerol synthase transmembrane domain-containing protein [Bacteroidota bacterium]